jgi:NodT family efflux transporter outer membrane factor (OMF) lipoprotein
MTVIRTAMLVWGATVLVAACGTAQPMKNSSIPEERAYMSNDELLTLSQRVKLGESVATEWWTIFSSQPLNDLIHKAIESNYELAAARETVAQAQEAVQAESGNLLPQVSIAALAGRQKYGVALFGPASFSIPPFTYYELGPSVTWTPDFFGSEQRELERKRALADYQYQLLDAAYVTLTGNTVSAALELASANAEIATVKAIVEHDEKTLALTRGAYDAGGGTKLDILGAQTQLANDQALLPSLEHRWDLARHALSILLGKAPADWSPPRLDIQDFSLPKEIPVSLPSELLKKRPDILAAQANLRAAEAAVGVANANLYPQVTLSANMMQEALTPAAIFRGVSSAWSLAAGLTAPVFNGGKLSAERRAAEHAYQTALANYRQVILTAFADVADALTALDHDEDELAILKNAVDIAANHEYLMLTSYQEGSSGLLQVQDSQRVLAKARLDLVRVQHRRYVDAVRLFVALGGSPLAPKM